MGERREWEGFGVGVSNSCFPSRGFCVKHWSGRCTRARVFFSYQLASNLVSVCECRDTKGHVAAKPRCHQAARPGRSVKAATRQVCKGTWPPSSALPAAVGAVAAALARASALAAPGKALARSPITIIVAENIDDPVLRLVGVDVQIDRGAFHTALCDRGRRTWKKSEQKY